MSRLRTGLDRAGLDARYFAWPPKDDPHRKAYRGLKPLEEKDAAVFFGRDAQIVNGLDRLRGVRHGGMDRVMIILGASGAGKSSFLRAGLLPRLRRDDRNFLPLPVIRPETAVMTGKNGLAAAVHAEMHRHGLKQNLAKIRSRLARGAKSFEQLLGELQCARSQAKCRGRRRRAAAHDHLRHRPGGRTL